MRGFAFESNRLLSITAVYSDYYYYYYYYYYIKITFFGWGVASLYNVTMISVCHCPEVCN